ncbi:40S ribosomal protein S27 [Vanessa cardui]|uniref:40S ribosomal protein S27 n=1 Tax=Vanessa cardui TaxID=171605 RepID=UPI001F14738B|nr:40S ribosomal protein S27 [Vanessa cardui]
MNAPESFVFMEYLVLSLLHLSSFLFRFCIEAETMPLAIDLLHPSPASERRKHKLKRLVPHPNSYFMDVKCPGCYKITTVFSHAQRVVVCAGCSTILCQPTGGRARLTEGCSFRRKQH